MLYLGRASVDITPAVGLPLGGWPVNRVSETVHEPMSCRVLALSDGKTEALIAGIDLLGLSTALARSIRNAVSDQTGVPRNNILLAASHSHSGPVMPPCIMEGVAPPDGQYLSELRRKVVGALTLARRERIPVRVGVGTGTSDLGVSRRRIDPGGTVYWPPRAAPDAPIDSTVSVIVFRAADASVPAILFGFACHPTVAGPSLSIGTDYPGFARRCIERVFPETFSSFVLGNCGDVRSNYTHSDGSFVWDSPTALIEEAGLRLGAEVVRVAAQVRDSDDDTLAVGHATGEVVTRSGNQRHYCDFHAIRIGPVDVVSNPGECFSQIGVRVRRNWPRPLVFSSITNGFIGYVPTRDAYEAGGYEVCRSFEYFGLDSPLAEGSDDEFQRGMYRALQALNRGSE